MNLDTTITGIFGSAIDFSDISKSVIEIEDIVHRLANINRFCGGTLLPYSVGAHCLSIYDLAESDRYDGMYLAYALLHDATEAFMSDIPSPLKRLLPDYQRIEKELHDFLMDYFNVELNDDIIETVAFYDKLVCLSEWKCHNNGVYDKAGAWKHVYGTYNTANYVDMAVFKYANYAPEDTARTLNHLLYNIKGLKNVKERFTNAPSKKTGYYPHTTG